MTQHSSLKSGRKRKGHRSVLKRFERLKILEEKKEWKDGDPIFGLPKVKTVRIRVKKEKAAAEAAPAPEAGVAPGATPAATPAQAAPGAGKEKAAPPKKEKEK